MISPVLVDRALGVAAAAADRPAAAVQHFVEAEALARRVGLQPELALALLQHGAFDSAALAEGERVAQAIDMHELARRMLQSSTGRRTSASERQSDDHA